MNTSDIFANQRQIWQDYQAYYTLARRALPFIVGVIIGGFIFSSDAGYATNLYTEIMSILATVGILDFFNQRRDTQNLKKRLIREAGSRSNETAKSAVEWLRAEGWLEGSHGLLQGADLVATNLQDANLFDSNLRGAYLGGANLKQAFLPGANLIQAYLGGANLQKADLFEANLERANVLQADLESTDLGGANLQGANLKDADLRYAKLGGANLLGANLEGTELIKVYWKREIRGKMCVATLPDGTKWTPETDMTRFTDENHPDFWRPQSEDK